MLQIGRRPEMRHRRPTSDSPRRSASPAEEGAAPTAQLRQMGRVDRQAPPLSRVVVAARRRGVSLGRETQWQRQPRECLRQRQRPAWDQQIPWHLRAVPVALGPTVALMER